jgi:hypothetical protein
MDTQTALTTVQEAPQPDVLAVITAAGQQALERGSTPTRFRYTVNDAEIELASDLSAHSVEGANDEW